MSNAHGFQIYINQSSGTAQKLGADDIRSIVKSSGIGVESLSLLPPDEFFNQMKILSKENSKARVLIGGGDGTITSVAKIMKEKDKAFGILPMGTMNLMAHDLGIPIAFEAAVNAYAGKTKQISIDVGYVNAELFLCSAAIGTIPESSVFREEHRTQSDPVLIPRLTLYVMQQLDPSHQRSYEMLVDGKKHRFKSAMLVISNNAYDASKNILEPALRRSSLVDGQLAVYSAAPANVWDKIRFLTSLGLGGWSKDPKVRQWFGRDILLKTGAEQELVSLDGETVTLNMPLRLSVERQSLKLWVPEKNDTPNSKYKTP